MSRVPSKTLEARHSSSAYKRHQVFDDNHFPRRFADGDIHPAKMADALLASPVNALVAQIPCA